MFLYPPSPMLRRPVLFHLGNMHRVARRRVLLLLSAVQVRYARFRPQGISPKEDPRRWWKFAYASVLGHIRDKRRNESTWYWWYREHLKERYIELHQRTQKKPWLPPLDSKDKRWRVLCKCACRLPPEPKVSLFVPVHIGLSSCESSFQQLNTPRGGGWDLGCRTYRGAGRGISGQGNFVWEISRFKLATKFPTPKSLPRNWHLWLSSTELAKPWTLQYFWRCPRNLPHKIQKSTKFPTAKSNTAN